MSEEEKSALDIIYSLPSILKKLESKIDVIDNNVKILNNKFLKLSQEKKEHQKISVKEEISKPEEILQPILPRAVAPDKMPEVNAIAQRAATPNSESTKLLLGNKKVFGYIKTTSMKPVSGATVKIFDSKNSLVREINSDKDGYWEARLPSGKFSCEILIGSIKPINRSFELTNDIKEFELK